uniref:60S ribosomal protein L31 n=1 Tax=Arundo donax TaxID=35708 RepID=A0A0A9FFY1_ARUDO
MKEDRLLVILDKLGTQTLQAFRRDLGNSDQRVELLLGIFLVVPLAGDPDTDTPWHAPDTTAPDLLVEHHINPDVCGVHCLLRKLPDLLDGVGCSQDELSITSHYCNSQHGTLVAQHMPTISVLIR